MLPRILGLFAWGALPQQSRLVFVTGTEDIKALEEIFQKISNSEMSFYHLEDATQLGKDLDLFPDNFNWRSRLFSYESILETKDFSQLRAKLLESTFQLFLCRELEFCLYHYTITPGGLVDGNSMASDSNLLPGH